MRMNNLSIILMLLSILACGVLSGHRYFAIPVNNIHDIDIIQVNSITPSLLRIARQTEMYVPLNVHSAIHPDDEIQSSESSTTRDYVDFGAHTGSNGAFSWYTDYPAYRL